MHNDNLYDNIKASTNQNNMSNIEELIEKHLDYFYEWVVEYKYSEAMDWCAEYCYHADDDHQEIIETYIDENPELIHEYIKSLKS